MTAHAESVGHHAMLLGFSAPQIHPHECIACIASAISASAASALRVGGRSSPAAAMLPLSERCRSACRRAHSTMFIPLATTAAAGRSPIRGTMSSSALAPLDRRAASCATARHRSNPLSSR